MQRLTVAVPDEGRVIVSGEPWSPQLSPLVSKPIESTLIGDDTAAVVGSTTTIFFDATTGAAELRAIVSTETSNGTMTNGTGFENTGGLPGFSTCTVSVAADWTSEGFIAVTHSVAVEQVVVRGAPFTRIDDDELPLPSMKFTPCKASGNPSTAPAMTLDGNSTSIAAPLVSTTVAVADCDGSAWLVAVTEIALGEGAAA